MQARRYNIQFFWNRFMAASAFVLTALLNIAVAPQSEETRVASAQVRQLDAVAQYAHRLPLPSRDPVDGRGSGGGVNLHPFIPPAAHSFARNTRLFFAPSRQALSIASRLVRAGESRAPPSI